MFPQTGNNCDIKWAGAPCGIPRGAIQNTTIATRVGGWRSAAIGRNREGDGGWLLIVAGVLLVLFFVLNLQSVEVNLILAKVTMPLIFALAIAAVLGALVGWALPRLRSSRSSSG